MDHRIALEQNTPLRFCNDRGEAIHYAIEGEIGRGASCIVYEASRVTETGDKALCRVKEYYPYQLDIRRKADGALVPAPEDAEAFCQGQEQFRSNFSRTNRLFYSGDNYSMMTNQLDIFALNGTSYLLSAYSSKKTLATYQPASLKECASLVREVAYVLDKVHRQGYLYLDTKPENVLVLDGYRKQVQLFDFDSLFPINNAQEAADGASWAKPSKKIDGMAYAKPSGMGRDGTRLFYTKGFAPIELQRSEIKHLGLHTDVYGVGALLFYLLFGRTPDAPDCEAGASYDFSEIQYDHEKCDDRIFASLADFFHHALAVYHADRYQGMGEVMERLQEIERQADETLPRLYSTPPSQIARPRVFHGREQELAELDRLLDDPDVHCLFLTGMGGIGKSTLAREYLLSHREKHDTLLYVHFKDSLEATIADDGNVEVNTLRQDEEIRGGVRYFDRKIQKIKELVRGTSSVLVIDDFRGKADADFDALLSTGLKVVCLSRKAPMVADCREMRLSAITDMDALLHIFEENLGRPITEEEQEGFAQIADCAERHTLVLELIAKQIANSHITIQSAARLASEHGFSAIAPEKVDYEKDRRKTRATIGNIIDALFEANALSPEKKTLMKVASLLGDNGMDIGLFQKAMGLPSKDGLNELSDAGWLAISGDTVSMHRVIQEAVRRWKWMPSHIAAAERFLTYFYVEIALESTKNDYPKKLRDELAKQKSKQYSSEREERQAKKRLEKLFGKGLPGKVRRERYARIEDESYADVEKLVGLLGQSEDLLRQCKREPAIKKNEIYQNLLYITVLNIPQYREEDVLAEAGEILKESDSVWKDTRDLAVEGGGANFHTLLQIYDKVIDIHLSNKRFAEAKDLMVRAGRIVKKAHCRQAYALYCDMLGAYYDGLLDGMYEPQTPRQKAYLDKMLTYSEKVIQYAKKDASVDRGHLYAKGLLDKAVLLLRSGRGYGEKVLTLMDEAKRDIMENTSPFADIRLNHYLVCAWCGALEYESVKLSEHFIQEALELSLCIYYTDMQIIEVLIPCANIYFTLECHEMAMRLLFAGVCLCAGHPNNDSYARVKQELCDHFLQVGEDAGMLDECQKFKELIEAENEEVADPKNRVTFPVH